MAKRKHSETAPSAARKPPAGGTPGPKRRHLPNWPLLAPALVGMALTAYLTATAWTQTAPALCGEGSGCDLVQSSRWGSLLGMPTAMWGLLGYLTLAYIALRVRSAQWHWQLAWLAAFTGLAVSVYLTLISVLSIGATCFYCLISLGLMALLTVIVTLQRPDGIAGFSWPAWAGQTAVVSLVLVGALHLHYTGVFSPAAGPEDPYLRGLAQHLAARGDLFYGAFW